MTTVAEEAGHSLLELALAFVLAHPAVTSPIIGPRTMEHLESQLSAADHSDPAILDRIDEIVPPGTNINDTDVGWVPSRHRRPVTAPSPSLTCPRSPRRGSATAHHVRRVLS